jgi:pyrophosphate--fructose-6-phosphate 1-phosphotransferase
MEGNVFEAERVQYQPLLPQSLVQIGAVASVVEKGISTSKAIEELFPQLKGLPLIRFTSQEEKKYPPLRVGVVLSGGQAPGGHNVIIGLFDALKKLNRESRLFGFLGGPAGLIENRYQELQGETLTRFRNTGGFDLIGSGRTKVETENQFEAVRKNCVSLKLDGLVIIGGDDSNTNAAFLAEYFRDQGISTGVIGVPKTIDGDLKNRWIEASFGFDTACKIYAEMIGNICRDARSAKKYSHFIKLMGRSASHITLECALQTHPNLALIGEEVAAKKWTLPQIVDKICAMIVQRAEEGKNYNVILIPEGLIEFIPEMKALIRELNHLLIEGGKEIYQQLSPEVQKTLSYLPEKIAKQLLLDRDPHGNVQVSHIATEELLIQLVQKQLAETPHFKGKFAPIGHFLGYEGRCGYPSNFDANYCYALGFTAAALVASGCTGYMSALTNLQEPPSEWVPMGVPLISMMDFEERKGKKKAVIKKALVDLSSEPFKQFEAERSPWAAHDAYRFPGPIQYFGPIEVCNALTFTLQLERTKTIAVRSS